MRYQSPPRAALTAATFAHPAFSSFNTDADWLNTAEWPTVAALNARWNPPAHTISGSPLHFVAQAPALADDGLHFESRIYNAGAIATREACWHDLFNALIWCRYPALKCALNAAYVREFVGATTAPRTRAQCALTHFDEGGALVILRDAELLELWDRHAWLELFWHQRRRWDAVASVHLIGHALYDHLLTPRATPVAKCVVVVSPHAPTLATSVRDIAERIVAGTLLRDPQELRPLPLAALTGWHPENSELDFYRTAPTFRPLRPGRRYPNAISIAGV